MNITYPELNFTEIRKDCYYGIIECNKRGLVHSAKWLAELNVGMELNEESQMTNNNTNNSSTSIDYAIPNSFDGICPSEWNIYCLAKSYFDCREYDRAAYILRNAKSPVPNFLHYYSTYMGKEKTRLESVTDMANFSEPPNYDGLNELFNCLRIQYTKQELDGYLLYLFGVILKKMNLEDLARNVLVDAINKVPTLWSAWYELAPLLNEKHKLLDAKFPMHWIKKFFIAYTYVELFCNDQGIVLFEELKNCGFDKCLFVVSQLAIAFHNKRDVDSSLLLFKSIHDADPYRLENLDILSNLYFVKEMKTEMSHLAQRVTEINRYRPESCCVIGNYYSIRGEHEKSVLYFQRALKLNPQYLSAWTLMGHEFMELQNTNAAIQSYRKAVEVNRRDYRAWYGLGQAYEILKMPLYSVYYYKIAQKLRPYDSRMLIALGETYERLEKHVNAVKCYKKACSVGDIEGIGLLRLANLYELIGDVSSALPAYIQFCADDRVVIDKAQLSHAYMILGNHFESIGALEQATKYAYKALEHIDTKDEANSLLRTIQNKRTLYAILGTAKRDTPES